MGTFDPTTAITGVIAGAVNTLKSAAKEPSVKAFVYTSSSWAAASPKANVKLSIDSNSWNKVAEKAAWASPPYTADRTMDVYAAGKSQAEAASWEFMKSQKPGFVFNVGKHECIALRMCKAESL